MRCFCKFALVSESKAPNGSSIKSTSGFKVDGVHVYLGGKATKEAKEARQLFKALPLMEAQEKVKQLMLYYRDKRLENESFESFDSRVLAEMPVEKIVEMIS
jgi:ferredoxin-nitrite reductase